MPRISNKVLIGLAGGAAALSVIGVGAGATFTDYATASGSYTVSHVAVTLDDTYGKIMSDQNSFNPQQWSWLAQQTTEGSNGSKGFTLYEADNGGNDSPTTNPLGSDTNSVANFEILKTPGSAQINGFSLTASVLHPSSAIVKESSITILMRNPCTTCDEAGFGNGVGIGDQLVYSGTLSNFLKAASGPGLDVVNALGGLQSIASLSTTAAKQAQSPAFDFLQQINGYAQGGSGANENGAVFTVSIAPTNGSYSNQAIDETLTPTFNANVSG